MSVPGRTFACNDRTCSAAAAFSAPDAASAKTRVARGTPAASRASSSTSSPNQIAYTYPGGSSTRNSSPFDMMGQGLLTPNSWTAPSMPGVYSITAVGKRTQKGNNSTITLTSNLPALDAGRNGQLGANSNTLTINGASATNLTVSDNLPAGYEVTDVQAPSGSVSLGATSASVEYDTLPVHQARSIVILAAGFRQTAGITHSRLDRRQCLLPMAKFAMDC